MIKDINKKENTLIDLLQEKKQLESKIKEIEGLVKPLIDELKPFRNEHLPRVNPEIFTKSMRLRK